MVTNYWEQKKDSFYLLIQGKMGVQRGKREIKIRKMFFPFQIRKTFCHNSFPLDLKDHKIKMESPPIFSVRV